MSSPWQWERLKSKIPTFPNSVFRFALLRTICVFSFALLCTVPSAVVSVSSDDCQFAESESIYAAVIRLQRGKSYELHRIIYSYVLYGFTLLHHFTSAFGPKCSLPNVIDVALILGETLLFTSQVASGRPAFYLPRQKNIESSGPVSCLSFNYLEITPEVAAFTCVTAISLMVLTFIRIAETVKSDESILARYDVTGLGPGANVRRPNGLKVLVGMTLWEPHFTGEGRQLVLHRGMTALFLMVLVLAFAFNGVIVDPAHEAHELPMMTSTFANDPTLWMSQDVYIVAGIPLSQSVAQFQRNNNNTIANSGVTVSGGCEPVESDYYEPVAQSRSVFYYTTFGNCNDTNAIEISVDFTAISRIDFESMTVLVMVGHSKNIPAVIRHTKSVILTDGMNITAFARQHKVRHSRYPALSGFGFFTTSDELVVSEITQITPKGPQFTDHTASLIIHPRLDFSKVQIVQDYRAKSILKGLSDVGGLWTFAALIFGTIYGSSLARVVFGTRPLSIFGVVHGIVETETLEEYRRMYPGLDPDMRTLYEHRGLWTLLVDKLVDLGLIFKADLPSGDDAV